MAILNLMRHVVTQYTCAYEQQVVSNPTACQHHVPPTTLANIDAYSVIDSNVKRLNDPYYVWRVPGIPTATGPLKRQKSKLQLSANRFQTQSYPYQTARRPSRGSKSAPPNLLVQIERPTCHYFRTRRPDPPAPGKLCL